MSSMAVVRGAVVDSELYVRYKWGEDSVLYKSTTPFVVSLDEEALANWNETVRLSVVTGADGNVSVACVVDEVAEQLSLIHI